MAQLKKTSESFGTPDQFDLTGLSIDELELIQEGLIELKNRLGNAPDFLTERRTVCTLYAVIDQELILIKEEA